MSRPEHWLFVVNPGAGAGKAGRVWERLTGQHKWLKNAVLICNSPDSLPEALKSALSGYNNLPKICSVGGDGSMHHLVNQLLRLNLKETPEIGIIPAGSGSDLCRHLKIPANPEKALTHLLNSKPNPAGLIRIQPHSAVNYKENNPLFAINICSAGISARVAKRVNNFGTTTKKSYLIGLISELYQQESLKCVLQKNGSITEGNFELILLAGGTHFGNGIPIMPYSSVFRRELKLMTIKSLSAGQMLLALIMLVLRRHANLSFVDIQTVEEIVIESSTESTPIVLEADGEVYSSKKFRISAEFGLISLLC